MVVFTCNHCGDSLQKPKVEKHCSFVCRAPKSLTCIDCLKDFRGEEYVSHTKCLTEEERYAAKGTFANGIIKKGELKQESWIEMIKSIIEKETNLKPSIRNLLNTISNYNNVPRKKPKFLNFIRSSSGGRVNMNDVEEVWNIIEKYKADQERLKNKNNTELCHNGLGISEEKLTNNSNDKTQISDKDNNSEGKKKKKKKENPELNGNTPTVEQSNEADTSHGEDLKKSKKKKKKLEDKEIHLETENTEINVTSENNEDSIKKKSKKKKLQVEETEEKIHEKKPKLDVDNIQEQMEADPCFDFGQKILAILASKGSISKNKLEKKVVSAYLKHSGLSESSPKVLKKFNKKLKKMDNIEIVNDTISLKTQ